MSKVSENGCKRGGGGKIIKTDAASKRKGKRQCYISLQHTYVV
jgi:hypothetical protein